MINDDLHAGIIDWQDITEEEARDTAINEELEYPTDEQIAIFQEDELSLCNDEHNQPPTSMSDIDFSDQQDDQS